MEHLTGPLSPLSADDVPVLTERARWYAGALAELGGSVLVVSQFTLYGDAQKGRRPSFIAAARPEQAIPLYEEFVNGIKALGIPVATGRFGAMMDVELVNEGPVTLILESAVRSQ